MLRAREKEADATTQLETASPGNLVGIPLSGDRLAIAAFEAHSPDRVTSLAQSMFFEFADGREGHLASLDPRGETTIGGADDFGARVPTGLVRDLRLQFDSSSQPHLYLVCVEAELRACVAQMIKAHEQCKMHIDAAHAAYDLAATPQNIEGASWIRKFVVAFLPVLTRLTVLTLLSAAFIVVFKSSSAASIWEVFDSKSGFLVVGLGILLTMMVGYGRDQVRALAVVRLSRERDRAVLAAEQEEAVRLYAACDALYCAVDRAWLAHAPPAAQRPDSTGTLLVLQGNRDRVLAKSLPRTQLDIARQGAGGALRKVGRLGSRLLRACIRTRSRSAATRSQGHAPGP